VRIDATGTARREISQRHRISPRIQSSSETFTTVWLHGAEVRELPCT
jgi:hypothetical protein